MSKVLSFFKIRNSLLEAQEVEKFSKLTGLKD